MSDSILLLRVGDRMLLRAGDFFLLRPDVQPENVGVEWTLRDKRPRWVSGHKPHYSSDNPTQWKVETK